MKRLLVQDGGRELVHDDLLQLDETTRASTVALCAAASQSAAFIVSGCRVAVTGSTVRIGSGVVFLSGQMLRLNTTADLTLPIEIVADSTPVLTDDRRYEDGSNHYGAGETFAIARNATSTPTAKIEITELGGGLTYAQVLAAAARPLGAIEWGAFDVATAFDNSGRGRGLHRGWALCNGVNGTVDLRGRFVAGYALAGFTPDVPGASLPEYATVGNTGGTPFVTLTENQLPPHSHANADYNLVLRQAPYNSISTPTNFDGGGNGNGGEMDIQFGRPLSSVGSGLAHENRPPFLTLVARQWIGL